MRLLVIGGVAGGASAAARVRRLDEQAEITILERGAHISFSNCSLPYYLGGVVAEEDDLIMMTPEGFRSQYRIDVQINTEAVAIDRAAKRVTARDVTTGEMREYVYDKLVLAPGASPVMPRSIVGIDGERVFSVRNVADIARIKNCMDQASTQSVAVVGGGFIGIEVAENLCRAGKHVTLLEGLEQVMPPFDQDMAQMFHREISGSGVDLRLGSTVTAIGPQGVTAQRSGECFTVPADAVIMAVGVAPETALARQAGLQIGSSGGIKVDRHMRTDDPDIYAVGDAAETTGLLTGKPGRLALAGVAQKEARVAADNICGITSVFRGFVGSSCLRVFGLNAAATGLNEQAAKAAGIPYDYVTVFAPDKVSIMPDCRYLAFKLLFEVPTGRLLGAQAIGGGEADKRVNAVAALISMGGTVEDLIEFEHCYAPLFATAKDVVHMAALAASNVLCGRLQQVHTSEVRSLVESGAYIVDVREADEFEAGHIKGAHNIPLSSLRENLDKIPRDIPVYLHCRSSQRSYYAYCALRGNGFDNVININGSFLGISLYEAFTDRQEGRVPIVTAYNFD